MNENPLSQINQRRAMAQRTAPSMPYHITTMPPATTALCSSSSGTARYWKYWKASHALSAASASQSD